MSIYCQQERGTHSKLYQAPSDDDVWDTDPNYVNDKIKNYGGKPFEEDSLDLKKLRQEVHQENDLMR